MSLRGYLVRKQRELRESDAEFGKPLGLTRQGWRHYRLHEDIEVSREVALRAQARFDLDQATLCRLYFGWDEDANAA